MRPHLEYGAPIWNPCTKKYINAIENVQRRATKQIPGLTNLSYHERLEVINRPTLQYRRYRGDILTVAHNQYGTDVSSEIIDFKSSTRGYNLRRFKFDIIKKNKQRIFGNMRLSRE